MSTAQLTADSTPLITHFISQASRSVEKCMWPLSGGSLPLTSCCDMLIGKSCRLAENALIFVSFTLVKEPTSQGMALGGRIRRQKSHCLRRAGPAKGNRTSEECSRKME
jgi:hypothetical protein